MKRLKNIIPGKRINKVWPLVITSACLIAVFCLNDNLIAIRIICMIIIPIVWIFYWLYNFLNETED
jgi:hypothetical protein